MLNRGKESKETWNFKILLKMSIKLKFKRRIKRKKLKKYKKKRKLILAIDAGIKLRKYNAKSVTTVKYFAKIAILSGVR